MAISKFTPIQKERVQRLELLLKKSTKKGDLNAAMVIIADLQPIYSSTGNSARLLQAKTRLYEAAMENGEHKIAEEGFQNVRQRANDNTRIYLEATALLAICYLRQNLIEKAEPMIKEVLINDKVIKSEKRRAEFRKLAIERFDEETLLFALKSNKKAEIDIAVLQKETEELLEQKNETEIFQIIGHSIPSNVKSLLLRLDGFSKKQLPTAERLCLPAPNEIVKDDNIGKTFFSSVKRTLYKSLCDPESEIYKAWFNKAFGAVFSKTYIVAAICESFLKIGIGIKALIISAAALVIKFGIEVYCDRFKPNEIMDLR